MAARPNVTPTRLLAALAAGLIAAGPALSQPQSQPSPRSQRGASAQPRQVRQSHRGESAQPRRGQVAHRGASAQPRRGPGGQRGVRAPRTRTVQAPAQPGNTIILDRGGTLLNRGAPMGVTTGRGRMGGNGAPFPILTPQQGGQFFTPSRRFERGSRFFLDDDDDDFRFVVDLGGGNIWVGDDPVYAPHGYWDRHPWPYRRYWYPQAAYFPGTAYLNTASYGYGYDTWPVVGTDGGYVDPFVNPMGPQFIPAAPPPPPRELTATERAQRALLSGEPDSAVTILREHARTNPEDAEAVRQLAVALLETGEPSQAVAVMAMAYDKDPALADRPLPAPLLYRDPGDLRRALTRAVTFANRVNTQSSWLLVATLMQAEGRLDVAGRMLDRATALGLDERIGAPMRRALGGG